MKRSLLVSLVAASMAMSGVAFAQEEVVTQNPDRQARQEKREEVRAEKKTAIGDRKEERQQNREETREQRCARIQERIDNGSANIGNRKEKHMSVYGNMVDRISKFMAKLEDKGYDVSKIQSDLAVLKEKIQKFSDDYAAQAAKIGDTKNLVCGQSDGEFKSGLVEARAMMKTVRADAADIRNYMLKTVRPDIQALRGQKVEAKDGAAE
ncbi:MAG: hypothetical protein WC120_02165 [Parcubacteria group bacterium]